MPETSASLLERLCLRPDEAAWQQLVRMYAPWMQSWLRKHLLAEADAEDLVQEVFAVVIKELPHFEHNQRPGAFRCWLRTILVNRLRMLWRARHGAQAADAEKLLAELEDPDSGLSRLWDEEHNRHVINRLLDRIKNDVAASTWQAFFRVTLEGKDEEAVAAELGMSVNAVCIAKSRVLNRLRQEATGLID